MGWLKRIYNLVPGFVFIAVGWVLAIAWYSNFVYIRVISAGNWAPNAGPVLIPVLAIAAVLIIVGSYKMVSGINYINIVGSYGIIPGPTPIKSESTRSVIGSIILAIFLVAAQIPLMYAVYIFLSIFVHFAAGGRL